MAELKLDTKNFDLDKVEVEHFRKALNWFAEGHTWPSIRDAREHFIEFGGKNYPVKVVFDQACYIAITGKPDAECETIGYTTDYILARLKKKVKEEFRDWLSKQPNKKNGTLLADRTMDLYISYANALYEAWGKKQSSTISDSMWCVLDPSVVDRILNDCEKDSKLLEIDRKRHGSGRCGLGYYKEFLLSYDDNGGGENREEKLNGGKNIILYGVPGCGKSNAIKKKIAEALSRDPEKLGDSGLNDFYHELENKGKISRVVFHPDYTYSDFTGQILPRVNEEKKVEYKFIPGPFTKILKDAINKPKESFFLIIEEINRGNAAAIFGDLFQLLDRDGDGDSEYEVDNHEIGKVVHDIADDNVDVPKIFIPKNLWLLATMNTSDQNVFPLDTAFQRRWEMELIPNDFGEEQEFFIGDTGITWGKFAVEVNKILEKDDNMASGDKRLGAWFIRPDRDKEVVSKERFANKVLKYLWDDAFKFNRSAFFNTDKYRTLEDVIENFVRLKDRQGFGNLFTDDIIKRLTVKTDKNDNADETEVENV